MKSVEPTGAFDAVAPDAPLVACVSAMHRFCIAAHVVECLLLGASAAGFVLGAAAWSGSSVVSAQGMVAACVGAGAAAVSWWLTDPRDRVDVARLVDRRCELQGAVITAYEREISGDRRPLSRELSRELSRRTLAKVDVDALRRSILQRRIGLLAVPCIAFALWSIAVDEAARRNPEREVAELLGSIADRAADLERTVSRHGASDRIDARSTSEVAKLARSARSARDEPHAGSARALRNVRALQHQVDEVSASIPPSEELQRSISRVRAAVDVARVKLEQQGPESRPRIAEERHPSVDHDESTRAARDASRGSAVVDAESSARSTPDSSSSSSGSSSPASGLDRAQAARSTEGDAHTPTHARTDDTAEARTATSLEPAASGAARSQITSDRDSPDRRDEAGVVGGMWWSARYDNVVERWVEMRRTSRNASR